MHLSQMGIAGNNHLGTGCQRQCKKFVVFRVAAVADKLGNFDHPQVSQQSIDKRLPLLRTGIAIEFRSPQDIL